LFSLSEMTAMPATCQTMTEPVIYTETYPDQLPGVLHFTCPRLHATLTPANCAARHGLALNDTHGQLTACRHCAIGRVHAVGQRANREALSEAVTRIDTTLAALCVRCGRQSSRLIQKTRCVSCYNREGEAKKGRNARGNVPVGYAPLRLRRVGLELSDGEIRWALFEAQTWLEPLLRGLRAYPGAKLYASQPSDDSSWNAEAQRFEYRDEQGRALAMEVTSKDGHQVMRYHPALPGELPAPVVAPVSLYDPGFIAEWLAVSEECQTMDDAWRALAYGCSVCRQGVMQARRRAGRLTVRCTGCGKEASEEATGAA
jgi:hypothetical protein